MSLGNNTGIIGDISTGFCSMSVEWRIPQFFSLPKKVDYYIYSPFFRFLDGIWFLKMWPNGATHDQSEGYVGLYLVRKQSNAANYCIWYKLKIQTINGTVMKSLSAKQEFSVNDSGWGLHQFIARSLLVSRKAEFNPQDIVIVSCDMCVQMPNTSEAATQTESHKDVEKLAENFKELFLSGEESDLTLSVRGREFKCHRAVLAARSPVFAAMLRQDMIEKFTGVVHIEDCEPEDFQEFLVYLYSGNGEDFRKENVFDLYQIADKYDVPEIKARCVQLLTIGLCVENFGDVVDLCLQHNESKLLQAATTFFAENTKNILVSLNWQNFMKKNPIGANEIHLKSLNIK